MEARGTGAKNCARRRRAHRGSVFGVRRSILVNSSRHGGPQVFSGQLVGVCEVDENIWLVSFLDFDLGYFDEKEGRVEPGPNPFEAKVLTMPPN